MSDHPRLRADDLPFPITEDVREWVNNLVDAFARDDHMLDCYTDEVHAAGRSIDEADEEWLHEYYYLRGKWRVWDKIGEYHFPAH